MAIIGSPFSAATPWHCEGAWVVMLVWRLQPGCPQVMMFLELVTSYLPLHHSQHSAVKSVNFVNYFYCYQNIVTVWTLVYVSSWLPLIPVCTKLLCWLWYVTQCSPRAGDTVRYRSSPWQMCGVWAVWGFPSYWAPSHKHTLLSPSHSQSATPTQTILSTLNNFWIVLVWRINA